MGTTDTPVRLRVGAGRDQRIVRPGDILAVGRAEDAGLRIDDPRVSRNHLRVYAHDGGWIVEDTGSSNGTFLEGRRISRLAVDGPCALRLGDPERGPQLDLAPVAEAAPPPPPAPPQPAEPPAAPPPATVHRAGGPVVRIGRDVDNDIVLDDLLVSRHHAEVRSDGRGGNEIVDLDSHNGTFVNGRRAQRMELRLNDVLGIGRTRLVLTEQGLTEYREPREIAYAANSLRVRTKKGSLILDGITFALDKASFLGVVGPSGSGKSTLVGALTGYRPADEGAVLFDGRDLYNEYDQLRQFVGYVPQDDILHMELTVGKTLEYAAELRFPPDVTQSDRIARVNEVLEELGLSHRRDLPVGKLSGGQRKRVSVALELLTRPSLIILDEPTSGLDPGYERSLMELLARLSRDGRTVVVVTHSVESLHLCDRILCLAPGGRMAWFGPPDRLTAYFERNDYQEVFRDLSGENGEAWQQRYMSHADFRRYVAEPLTRYQQAAGPREAPKIPRWDWFRQFTVLTRRYTATMFSDWQTPAVTFGLAIALSLLILAAMPTDEFKHLELPEVRLVSQAPLVLLTIMLAITELGAFNAVREIVKELPLYRRERAVGLSISAYVASKVAVLSVITVIQAVLLTVIVVSRQGGPESAAAIGWPLGELIIVVALAGLAAMALGLVISAAVSTSDRAMIVLPAVFIVQMVLASGAVFPDVVDHPGLKQASYLASAQWGITGAATTIDLNQLQQVSNLAQEIPIVDLSEPDAIAEGLLAGGKGDRRYSHEPRAWLGAVVALVAITVGLIVATGVVLRQYETG